MLFWICSRATWLSPRFFFWFQVHSCVCKPVNNNNPHPPPAQSQTISPLLEKWGPYSKKGSLAWSWSPSIATSPLSVFPSEIPVCLKGSVSWEHYNFSCSLSVSWQLTCPSPQVQWQPNSQGNCLPVVGVAAGFCLPCTSFPGESILWGINQSMKFKMSLELLRKISVPSFLSRSIPFLHCLLLEI